jgi:hypothetical protein
MRKWIPCMELPQSRIGGRPAFRESPLFRKPAGRCDASACYIGLCLSEILSGLPVCGILCGVLWRGNSLSGRARWCSKRWTCRVSRADPRPRPPASWALWLHRHAAKASASRRGHRSSGCVIPRPWGWGWMHAQPCVRGTARSIPRRLPHRVGWAVTVAMHPLDPAPSRGRDPWIGFRGSPDSAIDGRAHVRRGSVRPTTVDKTGAGNDRFPVISKIGRFPALIPARQDARIIYITLSTSRFVGLRLADTSG